MRTVLKPAAFTALNSVWLAGGLPPRSRRRWLPAVTGFQPGDIALDSCTLVRLRITPTRTAVAEPELPLPELVVNFTQYQ
jgi:hypothetical protein